LKVVEHLNFKECAKYKGILCGIMSISKNTLVNVNNAMSGPLTNAAHPNESKAHFLNVVLNLLIKVVRIGDIQMRWHIEAMEGGRGE